jgi:predicted adenylyl cyclase CyaB
MSNKYKEVEVKVVVSDLKELEIKIKENNGEVIHPEVFQRTVRFDTPNLDLENQGKFLRVRTGEKNIMTVKAKQVGNSDNYLTRGEWEIEINDPETAREMMKVIGFSREFIMEKI